MNCHDARELFSALIDETLTREERADVYGHLATCADCRRELTAIERTVALVRGTTPARAPVGFVDGVVAAVRPTPWYVRAGRAILLPWPVKLPLGAAALLLVGGLAVLLFRGTQEQQRASYDAKESPGLADRSAPPVPAAPPATSAPDDTAVASRLEQEAKQEAAPAEPLRRDEAPAAPEARQKSPGKRAATEALSAAAAPDVVARLTAPDRDVAERALAALVARLAGTVTGRRLDGDIPMIELVIPRERYDDFTREVGRLGTFRVESESPAPSGTVRIAVHLAS